MIKIGIIWESSNVFELNEENTKIKGIMWKKIFKQYWLDLVRLNYNDYNFKKNVFTNYVDIENWNFLMVDKEYRPDILWRRSMISNLYVYEIFKKFTIVPSKKIILIQADKWEIYLFLAKYQPITTLLKFFFEKEESQNLFTEDIIIKPVKSCWWSWIIKYKKSELINLKEKYKWLEMLFIVQQFKDFSNWYPWLVDSNHNLRLVYLHNKLVYSTITISEKNSSEFIVNEYLWSIENVLQIDKIPQEVILLANNIKDSLDILPNDYYSLDFWYCKQDKTWYLFEINTNPWFPTDMIQREMFLHSLAEFFKTFKV